MTVEFDICHKREASKAFPAEQNLSYELWARIDRFLACQTWTAWPLIPMNPPAPRITKIFLPPSKLRFQRSHKRIWFKNGDSPISKMEPVNLEPSPENIQPTPQQSYSMKFMTKIGKFYVHYRLQQKDSVTVTTILSRLEQSHKLFWSSHVVFTPCLARYR